MRISAQILLICLTFWVDKYSHVSCIDGTYYFLNQRFNRIDYLHKNESWGMPVKWSESKKMSWDESKNELGRRVAMKTGCLGDDLIVIFQDGSITVYESNHVSEDSEALHECCILKNGPEILDFEPINLYRKNLKNWKKGPKSGRIGDQGKGLITLDASGTLKIYSYNVQAEEAFLVETYKTIMKYKPESPGPHLSVCPESYIVATTTKKSEKEVSRLVFHKIEKTQKFAFFNDIHLPAFLNCTIPTFHDLQFYAYFGDLLSLLLLSNSTFGPKFVCATINVITGSIDRLTYLDNFNSNVFYTSRLVRHEDFLAVTDAHLNLYMFKAYLQPYPKTLPPVKEGGERARCLEIEILRGLNSLPFQRNGMRFNRLSGLSGPSVVNNGLNGSRIGPQMGRLSHLSGVTGVGEMGLEMRQPVHLGLTEPEYADSEPFEATYVALPGCREFNPLFKQPKTLASDGASVVNSLSLLGDGRVREYDDVLYLKNRDLKTSKLTKKRSFLDLEPKSPFKAKNEVEDSKGCFVLFDVTQEFPSLRLISVDGSKSCVFDLSEEYQKIAQKDSNARYGHNLRRQISSSYLGLKGRRFAAWEGFSEFLVRLDNFTIIAILGESKRTESSPVGQREYVRQPRSPSPLKISKISRNWQNSDFGGFEVGNGFDELKTPSGGTNERLKSTSFLTCELYNIDFQGNIVDLKSCILTQKNDLRAVGVLTDEGWLTIKSFQGPKIAKKGPRIGAVCMHEIGLKPNESCQVMAICSKSSIFCVHTVLGDRMASRMIILKLDPDESILVPFAEKELDSVTFDYFSALEFHPFLGGDVLLTAVSCLDKNYASYEKGERFAWVYTFCLSKELQGFEEVEFVRSVTKSCFVYRLVRWGRRLIFVDGAGYVSSVRYQDPRF